MMRAQFIPVTTTGMGPADPIKKMFAAGFDTPKEAIDVITAKLKPGEVATWVEGRSLSIGQGEVRHL